MTHIGRNKLMSCQLIAVQHSNIKLAKKFLQSVVIWNIWEEQK